MKPIGHRCVLISLLCLGPQLARAADDAAPASDPASLIRPLLATRIGRAVCFEGRFEGLKVNLLDYSRTNAAPAPKLVIDGNEVTRPNPYVHADQELTAMTLLVHRDGRVHESWDEMHDFRLAFDLKGWPRTLWSAGECPLRRRDRPIAGSSMVIEANTDTLYCGIDCDGGGMSVERVPGTGEVLFRFATGSGGLRVSNGCGGGEPLHVGGPARVYDEAAPKEFHPVAFRLRPMPAKACRAFRKTSRKALGIDAD